MTNDHSGPRIVGSLRAADGAGVVRIEERYDTDADDLWSALTEPGRLARWYGEVTGDLREGGDYTTYLEGPDIRGTGHIERCDPPRELRVRTRETEESAARGGGPAFNETVVATLTPDGDGTLLVFEVTGPPLGSLPAYGVGWQLLSESLAAHLAGRERPDVGVRWDELQPSYDALAADL